MPASRCPHFLEIIEGADFRPENVNYHVAGIDEHPVAVRHSFHPRVRQAGGSEIFEHAIGERAHMAARPSRGHNHGVGDAGFAGEIDGDGFLGLHVVEAREHQVKNLLGVWTHLGDGFGSADGASARECRYPQGPFLSFIASSEAKQS